LHRCAGSNSLTYLHHPNALIKRPDDRWQFSVESLQQRLLPTIADPHPKQFSRVALPVGKMEEILILADDNPVAGGGIIPNFEVGCFVHVQAEDMAGLVSTLIQKPAKGLRELVVHQKLHALVSTT
jgi:hypothetical protein